MVAFMAMLTALSFAVSSCEKENVDTNNANNTEQQTTDSIPTPNPGPDTTHPGPQPVAMNWVDLGLPSGLLWAECNLGADAPEDHGDYYAWGETSTKTLYSWSTYQYCTVDSNGFLASLTKYDSVDMLTLLQSSDDAATATLGSQSHTPTKADWEELMGSTSVEWTTRNGVRGREFTAVNGNSIFLPAAGYRQDERLVDDVSYGNYASSTLVADQPRYAYIFHFYSVNQAMYDNYDRCIGLSVRAVRTPQN